jgi:hypothetical protein
VVEHNPPTKCQYPVDSFDYIHFHEDPDGNWHDEGTCMIEKLGLYAPIDRSVEHVRGDKIYDWRGFEIGTCWPATTYYKNKVILSATNTKLHVLFTLRYKIFRSRFFEYRLA